MNADEYKKYVTFSNQEIKYLYEDCPICYSFIDNPKNVIFGCNHNSCLGCCNTFLIRTFKCNNIPVCFICRTPITEIHMLSNESKQKMMKIFSPQMIDVTSEQVNGPRYFNLENISSLARNVFMLVFLILIYTNIVNEKHNH